MAEGVGFEPTVPCGTPLFKSGTIDHSDTPPDLKQLHYTEKLGEFPSKAGEV